MWLASFSYSSNHSATPMFHMERTWVRGMVDADWAIYWPWIIFIVCCNSYLDSLHNKYSKTSIYIFKYWNWSIKCWKSVLLLGIWKLSMGTFYKIWDFVESFIRLAEKDINSDPFFFLNCLVRSLYCIFICKLLNHGLHCCELYLLCMST